MTHHPAADPGGDRVDYSTVTEHTGNLVTREAWESMCSRYRFAGELVRGKRVLEVACGSGQGLGYLARRAKLVVGGDLTPNLLARARRHYQSSIRLVRLDGHALPFPGGAFDVLLLYEAIYYLRDPVAFLAEAHRLLGPGGQLLICSANPERPDFNPSPFSHTYYSGDALRDALEGEGFAVELWGAYPVRSRTLRDRLVMLARQAAVRLRLIPKTMDGKVWLKRLVYGRLVPIKPEVDEGVATATVSLPAGPAPGFQVIYAIGRKR